MLPRKIIFNYLFVIITLPIFFHHSCFAVSTEDPSKFTTSSDSKETNNLSPLFVLATTSTTGSGNWSNTGKWSAGAVPGITDIVTVNYTMTLDTSIKIAGGGYYTINSPVTETAGGYAYSLNISGTGASNGVLEVKSTMTFEGAGNINSRGKIIVRSGATLTLGPTTFFNNSIVQVDAGGTLIINGTLTNNNNSNNITINGSLVVNVNFSGGVGSAIVGTGDFNATGSIVTSGSGTVFGSTTDCNSTNCSGNNLCSVTNTISSGQSICSNVSAATLTGSTVASATYLWESSSTGLAGSFTSASGTNNGVNYSPGTLSSTTYFRRQVISGGCTSKSNNLTVSVTNALPVSVSIASSYGGTSVCNGTPVLFTATVTNGGSTPTYQWKSGGVNISGATSSTYSTTFANGNYSITCVVTSSLSCTTGNPATSNTLALTVSGNAPSAPTSTAGGSVCGSGSASLTVSGGQTYNWYSVPTGGSLLGTGSPFSTPSISTTTTYYVATQSAGGCEGPRTAVVAIVNPVPSVPVITAGGATTFCAGGSVNLTSDAATSYLWSNGATTQTISVNASGSYSVTVSNASGCSRTSAATLVTVNPLPFVPAITAGGPTTFCSGGSVNLTSDAANSYLWSDGATTQTISVTTSGSYTVTVSDGNGCTSTSAATVITVNSLPSVPAITAGGATTFCAGGSVNLTSDAETSYLWSNGATTQTISVSSSGNYSVTVTNSSGCQASSATTSIIVNPLPSASITPGGSVSLCSYGSVDLAANGANAYLWSNAATTQTIHVNTAGSYTVTVTDTNGCQATSAPTVVSFNSCIFTWTGALGSDWNTAANWNTGAVPAAYDDVIVPSGTLNKPIITGGISFRTLTINAGAAFQVNSGAVLNSSGDFIKNGTYTDNGGTTIFAGTSLQNVNGAVNFSSVTVNNAAGVTLNNPCNISGTLTLLNGQLNSNGNLNMNLNTGTIAYSASDNGGVSGNMTISKNIAAIKTHYVSSPLTGSVSGDFYDDAQVINPSTGLTRLFNWDLSTQSWTAMYGTSTPLQSLNGYSLYFTATTVLDFSGTYTHKNIPAPISYTNAPAGANVLVGNPYPSTLDWNNISGWSKSNINNAIYLWDAKNSRYSSYVNGLGVNGGTQYIPSMQAFFVITTAAGDASIGVNNNARLTSTNPALWRTGTMSNSLKLSLSSGEYSDETILNFNENGSDQFDYQMDALKLKNNDLTPSFYSVSGGREYSINTLSAQPKKVIPLNIEAGFSGTYTITNEELGSFNSEYSLVLEDKLLNTYTDLKTSGYTFSINPDQGKNRFNLVFRTADAQGSNIIEPSVNISSNGKDIKVSYLNLDNSSATFSLYNTLGQLISNSNFDTSSGEYINNPANIAPGIYVVKVMAGNKLYSSKIYLSE